MNEENKKIRFHVIHSVKGGCGKTSFSLMKSIELAEKVPVDKDSKAKVLYLDCDFRGSALKVLLYGVDGGVHTFKNKELEEADYSNEKNPNVSCYIDLGIKQDSDKTLSDFINQNQQVDFEDIIVHGCTYIDNGVSAEPDMFKKKFTITGKIDFIFSPSESNKKSCFSHTALHSGKDAMLNIGIFRLRMRKLLGKILNYGELNEGHSPMYTDIVLDMPPGNDEYSDALLREINELVNDKKTQVIYYNLTTMDRGHMYATAEYIADLLEVYDENPQICCVFSEISENELGEKFDKLDQNFSDVIGKNKRLNGYLSNKLCYFANRFSKEYYETTHSGSEAIKFKCGIVDLLYTNEHITEKKNGGRK